MSGNDLSSRVDALCDRFETARQGGDARPLEAWVAEAGEVGPAALPELALLDLDYRARRGESPRAAEYFSRWPTLADNVPAAVRLVAAEGRADASRTEDVLRGEYPHLAASPEWARQTWPQAATAPDVDAMLKQVLLPGGKFGDYAVAGVLGSGGMGVILRAREEKLRRDVALKLMWPHVAAKPNAKKRFLQEARAAAEIDHPRVVAIYRVDEANGVPFIAMPLLRGEALSARLRRGSLNACEAARVARETAEGLAAAHERGLVHRDIKPDNVFLETTPDGQRVRLLDFGLAHDADEGPLTQSGQVVGTPAYMAPEQAEAAGVGPRSDLFSLGAVLYEMLTGSKPFARPTLMATLSALAGHDPTPPREVNPAVPEGLSALVMRMLAKKPEDRPASAAAVAAELRPYEFVDAPTQSMPAAKGKPGRRRLVAAALVAALMLLTPCLWPWFGPKPGESEPEEAKPLRVVSIDLNSFEKGPGAGQVFAPLKLGKQAFAARLGDKVQLKVALSRPGYAYVIALLPNGEVQVCWPDDPAAAPPLSDAASYPFGPGKENECFDLTDGEGVQAFVAVASETPLPPFKEWIKANPPPWSKEIAKEEGRERVWTFGDDGIDEVGPAGNVVRGKGGKLPGRAHVLGLAAWLRGLGTKGEGKAFVVGPAQ